MMDTLSKSMESTPPRVNPNVDCGLWVMTMCPWRFIAHKECIIWRGMWIIGEAMRVCGTGDTWELSVPFPQICCGPKTTLKISSL